MLFVYLNILAKFADYSNSYANEADKSAENSACGTRKTGKWLAHALGKNESTVSRWCTNEVQPSVETLLAIAETLKIDIKELLCSTQICNQDDDTQI